MDNSISTDQRNWNSLEEIFSELNQKSNYLVLRNYEAFDNDAVFLKDHEDIDFLCDDADLMASILDARPRKEILNRRVQFWIIYKNEKMKIDIREVGDGYYDKRWALDCLNKRQMSTLGFYVMDPDNYFFTLAYHAILQKKELSEEYLGRLKKMGEKQGYTISSEQDLLNLINSEMIIRKGYHFTYCRDFTVPNRFELVDRKYCRGKMIWVLRQRMYNIRCLVRKVRQKF